VLFFGTNASWFLDVLNEVCYSYFNVRAGLVLAALKAWYPNVLWIEQVVLKPSNRSYRT